MFLAAEFLGSKEAERLTICRQKAREACALAEGEARVGIRESYLKLQKQWMALATKIERSENPYAGLEPRSLMKTIDGAPPSSLAAIPPGSVAAM